MAKLGVINLGLNPQGNYLKDFLSSIRGILDSNQWDEDIPVFSYQEINPTEIAELCQAIILSPGDDIPLGLLDHKRAEKDQNIGTLYTLIHTAVQEGVPLIGINAGHEALNLAYGWAIGKIPEGEKEEYQREQVIDLSKVTDPATTEQDQIVSGLDYITISLSSEQNFAVLPRDQQKKRFGQDRVIQLAHHMGYPLISRVISESGAPVYGVQFNIQLGTEKVFENFFHLASQYLETK